MKKAFLWLIAVAFFSSVAVKSEYFSDESEEDYKKLQEIERFLRKRVEEVEAAEEASDFGELDSDSYTLSQSSKKEYIPPFQYNLPAVNTENEDSQPFAVGPFDPRYYQDFGRPAEPPSGVPESAVKSKEKRPYTESSKKEIIEENSTKNKDPPLSYVQQVPLQNEEGFSRTYYIILIVISVLAAIISLIGFIFGFYRLQKNAKAAADVDYPAYGVTGPNKDISPTSGDRRLAHSAQMYHYQHQKQQIIAMESMSSKERRSSVSDAESEEENEEGDYTVYECPGLASTGEMEVKNPLFQDDQTPASKPTENLTEESRELPK